MKITKDLAAKLLEESPSFRAHVLNIVCGFSIQEELGHSMLVEDLIDAAWGAAYDKKKEGKSGKIAAIKAVREYAILPRNIPAMNEEFPQAIISDAQGVYCTLAWAKDFVEKHEHRIKY